MELSASVWSSVVDWIQEDAFSGVKIWMILGELMLVQGMHGCLHHTSPHSRMMFSHALQRAFSADITCCMANLLGALRLCVFQLQQSS